MNTVQRIGTAFITLASIALVHEPAQACTFTQNGDMGDNFAIWDASGWGCQQAFISYFWSAFSFDQGDWDDGWGYENACDISRPLARTFNGLYSLGYSSTGTPSCSTNQSNITLWAMCWSASQIDELDGRCTNGTLAALTRIGSPIDNWTQLYLNFFYNMTTAVRGGVIFHEARHASGCSHNGNPNCPFGSSCDFSYGNGCKEGNGPVQGANTYEVNYLSWYLATAWRTTQALKDSAFTRANLVLANQFDYDPCFRLSSNGGAYNVC